MLRNWMNLYLIFRRIIKYRYTKIKSFQARLQLVTNLMSQEKHLLGETDVTEIAKLSEGFSGADMRQLCSEASMGPIRCIDLNLLQNIEIAEVHLL